MSTFKISLAGVNIGVTSQFDSTENYCREYLTDKSADFSVAITPEDILYEREQSEEPHSDKYLETLALYRKIAIPLLDFGAVVFHGSVVALDGKAYIFTAPSGTGKTTHTRLWLKNIPGVYVLNGDKPLLRVTNGGIYACGTPWQGKEHYGVNEILPLKAICILFRAEENSVVPLTPSEAVETLISQTNMPHDGSSIMKTLTILDSIASSVKLYSLRCNMEDEAAIICKNAIV